MNIHKCIKIIDLCLYLKKEKILVIGDVHIGYEEALNKQGILMPRFQFPELIKRLEKIVKDLEVKEVILIGDLKHEFGTISETEWRHTLQFLDFLFKFTKKIILIRGNHDTILGPIADKRGLEIKDYYKVKDVYFCHGDLISDDNDFKKSKIIVIGHVHPAVSLKERRVETYKCFLKGRWKRKILIVMPSFNLVTEGVDILKEELLSPFLHQNLDDFDVYIVEDKVYEFGKLKNIK